MTVSVTTRPTSGFVALETAVHVTASDVTRNETNGTERKHYLTLTSGSTTLRSVTFSGDFTWDGVLIPAAGTWTATLAKSSDDSTVATTAISVA